MKRLFFAIFAIFGVLSLSAQGIYTKVRKYDKFDDVLWEKEVKTLITVSGAKITIETKGSKPVEYCYYDEPLFANHDGRRDSIVNLFGNVYGYEVQYSAFPKDTVNKIIDKVDEYYDSIPDSLITMENLEERNEKIDDELFLRLDDVPEITFRTISKYQYVFEYETDLVWIRFKDGSRIIYSKR